MQCYGRTLRGFQPQKLTQENISYHKMLSQKAVISYWIHLGFKCTKSFCAKSFFPGKFTASQNPRCEEIYGGPFIPTVWEQEHGGREGNQKGHIPSINLSLCKYLFCIFERQREKRPCSCFSLVGARSQNLIQISCMVGTGLGMQAIFRCFLKHITSELQQPRLEPAVQYGMLAWQAVAVTSLA